MNMTGKFFIGENSTLQIEDIFEDFMVCSFHSLLNYRVIGNIDKPIALDPVGGPFIEKNNFYINEWKATDITWSDKEETYLLLFHKK